jgi:hypothetical protein
MKTLYATVLLCLLCQPLAAQQPETVPTISPVPTISVPVPQELASVSAGPKTDTLIGNLMKSSGFTVYTFSPDPQNPMMTEPVTGTNSLYFALGEKISYSGSGNVTGMLLCYAQKTINGAPDTMMIGVAESSLSGGLPTGNFYGMASFTTDHLDTSTSQLRFTPVLFPLAAPINRDFVALVTTRGESQTDPSDVVSIFSSRHGDGKKENRACFLSMDMQNQQMVTGNLSEIINNSNGEPLDIDLAIIPIVERTSAASVTADDPTVNGVTLRGAYPNPAVDKASVMLALDKASSVDLQLLDMSGAVLRTIHQDNLAAGEHSIDIDLSGLASGTYMYAISTDKAQVAGKLTVAR